LLTVLSLATFRREVDTDANEDASGGARLDDPLREET
jgi:hypothetical protein